MNEDLEIQTNTNFSTLVSPEFCALNPSGFTLPGLSSTSTDLEAVMTLTRDVFCQMSSPDQTAKRADLGIQLPSRTYQFVVTTDFSALTKHEVSGEQGCHPLCIWVSKMATEPNYEEILKQTELTAKDMAKFAIEAETTSMSLDELKLFFRNGLIARIHYAYKQARQMPIAETRVGWNYGLENRGITYEDIKRATHNVYPRYERSEIDDEEALIEILQELGFLPEGSIENKDKVVESVRAAKKYARDVVKRLDAAIKSAFDDADIENMPGPSFDFLEGNFSRPLISLLGITFGLVKTDRAKDQYEAQTLSMLNFQLLRIIRSETYKLVIRKENNLGRAMQEHFYNDRSLLSPQQSVLLSYSSSYTGEKKRQEWYDVYIIEALDGLENELTEEERMIYNSGFRPKDFISSLLKMIAKQESIENIVDAVAGEIVLINLTEADLNDPQKGPIVARLMRRLVEKAIEAISKAAGQTLNDIKTVYGEDKMPEASELKKGEYTIERKTGSSNANSFNFTAEKGYIMIPTKEGGGIRCEIRVILGDCYLMSHKFKDSLANHDRYKERQGMSLCERLDRTSDSPENKKAFTAIREKNAIRMQAELEFYKKNPPRFRILARKTPAQDSAPAAPPAAPAEAPAAPLKAWPLPSPQGSHSVAPAATEVPSTGHPFPPASSQGGHGGQPLEQGALTGK